MKNNRVLRIVARVLKNLIVAVFFALWSAGMLIGDIPGMISVGVGIPVVLVMTVWGEKIYSDQGARTTK